MTLTWESTDLFPLQMSISPFPFPFKIKSASFIHHSWRTNAPRLAKYCEYSSGTRNTWVQNTGRKWTRLKPKPKNPDTKICGRRYRIDGGWGVSNEVINPVSFGITDLVQTLKLTTAHLDLKESTEVVHRIRTSLFGGFTNHRVETPGLPWSPHQSQGGLGFCPGPVASWTETFFSFDTKLAQDVLY